MAYYPRLRDMREDHDLTQQKLAEYLGMPQPQYFRYEQGLRDIPTDILIQLAKLYNTTTDYLLGLTDDPVIPWRQGGASRTPPPTTCPADQSTRRRKMRYRGLFFEDRAEPATISRQENPCNA